MVQIDWRPTAWSFAWSWILGFIPSIFVAIKAGTTRYSFDDGAFVARTGLVTKRTTMVDLYRVKTVSAVDSPLSGGSVTVTNQDGSGHRFGLVRYPDELARRIRGLAESTREGKDFKYRENF